MVFIYKLIRREFRDLHSCIISSSSRSSSKVKSSLSKIASIYNQKSIKIETILIKIFINHTEEKLLGI